jgi:hypothetical protein
MYLLVLQYFRIWSGAQSVSIVLILRRKDLLSRQSVMACEPRTLNDLPDEILLKILSHLGPEDLSFNVTRVCKRWNRLAKDKILWKKHSYICYHSSDISRIAQVRCTALLGFRTNYLMNFAPSGILKVLNLKEHFVNWTSFHPEVRQVSRGLHCVTPSGCVCVHAMLQPWLQVLFHLRAEILTLIYFCNVYFEFLSLV